MKGDLRVGLDAPLPPELAVGAGTVVLVAGWCWNPACAIEHVATTVDGQAQPVLAHGMPRLDLLRESERSGDDPHGHAYRSGFWGLARVLPGARDPVEIGLHVTYAGGESEDVPLAAIPLRRPEQALAPQAPGDGPLVAICMATYDPPDDLLTRQLESIRAQTHTNWVCVISDDHSRPERLAALEQAIEGDMRFALSRADRRLGFYRNFERALELAPGDAEFVALADQDDAWHPDKLATLLDAAAGGAQLAYSDARVVARDGRVLAETFWDRRANNTTDLFSQLVANAVTGAASLFPRRLLDAALPFPPGQWNHFHDHWLGLCALSTGDIAYVDRPLYDYVQHTTATIGHEDSTKMPSLRDRWRALRDENRSRVRLWRRHYFADALRLEALVQILELRGAKRRAMGRYAAAERSWFAVARLFARGARELARRRPETLGAEWMLGYAFLWRRLLALTARDRPQRTLRLDALPPTGLGRETRRVAETLPADVAGVGDKVAPLELHVVDTGPRVNVLVPALDLEHFFAGYIGKLNLALRLARRGPRVRVVLTDTDALLPTDRERARAAIESYEGLAGLFDAVEVEPGRAPGGLAVSADDRFIATTWWTAHLAHAAVQRLGGERFLYLIQEYEPLTHPSGSWAALAEASYALPHAALYSTELLRDFFAERGLGAADAAVFRNAMTPVAPPRAEVLASRRPRRLLVYARPEPHAARNLYELALLGLRRALQDGALRGWELRGIGTTSLGREVKVGDATLELLPRTAQADYAALLAEHDAGLALMHTPHPSMVPIEMAAAGLATVTSTYANKTATALQAISSNLIAAEPTIDGVASALRAAEAAAEDADARVKGAAVDWPRSWDEAFSDALLDRIEELLG